MIGKTETTVDFINRYRQTLPYQDSRRDRLTKDGLSHRVDFIVLPDIKTYVSESLQSAVIAALVDVKLLSSRKRRRKLRLVAKKWADLHPTCPVEHRARRCNAGMKLNRLSDIIPREARTGASFSSCHAGFKRCARNWCKFNSLRQTQFDKKTKTAKKSSSTKLNRLLDIIPREARSVASSSSCHDGFNRCARNRCKFNSLRQTQSDKKTKTVKKSSSSNAVFQSSLCTGVELNEPDNKSCQTSVRASCADLNLVSPLLSILEDKSIKFVHSLPDRGYRGLNSLVVTYDLEQPVRQYESNNSVKPLPPDFVSEHHSYMYKAAFEFAKAHGYDFAFFNNSERKKMSFVDRHRKIAHLRKRLNKKKPAMCFPLAPKVSNKTFPYYVIDTEPIRAYLPELGVMKIDETDSVFNDTVTVKSISNSPHKMCVVASPATRRCEQNIGQDKLQNRYLESSGVIELTASEDVDKYEKGRVENFTGGFVKTCSSFIIAEDDSGRSKTVSVLPRLTEKTSKEYKLCNSLSAAIFREIQLSLRTGGVEQVTCTSEIGTDSIRDEKNTDKSCGKKESSQSNNRVSALNGADILEAFHAHQGQDCVDQSCGAGNINNSALPEMQLSLDDLRNDVSFTDDDDDHDDRRRESRRSREVSHSACQIDEVGKTVYQSNAKFSGRIKLPVLLNNCNRQKGTKIKPDDSVSSIPPLISTKSSKNAGSKRVGRQRRKKRGETELNSLVSGELCGKKDSTDTRGLCGTNRPTWLSPVVKESYSVSVDKNSNRDVQGFESNVASVPFNADGVNDSTFNPDQTVFQIGCFNSEKINSFMPGAFSSCPDGDEENKFILKQIGDRCAREIVETTSQKDGVKHAAVLITPGNSISRNKPEHSRGPVKVKENRFLPSLSVSENHRRATNVHQGDDVHSVSAVDNFCGSPVLNANNNSTQSENTLTACKKRRTATDTDCFQLTSQANNKETSNSNECLDHLNLSRNAISRGRRSATRVFRASDNELSRYQDRFIKDLNLELQSLVEDHFRPMRYVYSDINTSNTTKRGHQGESNGRGIRFGEVVNHMPARNLRACSGFQVSGDLGLAETHEASNYSADDQSSASIPGEDGVPDQQYNKMKLFLNMAYDRDHQSVFAREPGSSFSPTTENYWETAAQDRPQHLFPTQTPAASQKDEYASNCLRNDKNSAFTTYFPQPVTEDPMEFEESSQGYTYPPALLHIYQQLNENLQLSHGLFAEQLEIMKQSFYRDMQSLRSLVDTKYDQACAFIASGNVATLTSREGGLCQDQQINNDNHARDDETNFTVNQTTYQAPHFLAQSNQIAGFLTDKAASKTDCNQIKTISSKKVSLPKINLLKPVNYSSSVRYRTKKIERTRPRRMPKRKVKENINTSRQQGREWKTAGSRKVEFNKPLDCQSKIAGGKAANRYSSNQHSRACRRRHAAYGACCNLCLQKAPTTSSDQPAKRTRRKINACKRPKRKQKDVKSSKCAKTSILKKKIGKKMSSPKKRKSFRRRNSDTSCDKDTNRTCNNKGHGSFEPKVDYFANRNQNSRSKYRNRRKKSENETRKGSKVLKSKSVYAITRKGERALYESLKIRYIHLLKYVHKIQNGAVSYKKAKDKRSDPQNLSIRFRNLVTHFPPRKLQALENMIEKYEVIIDRYHGHGVTASSCSSEQPKQSLNDDETIRVWSQRNNSFQKTRLSAREHKKPSHSPRPVDSLLLARRRLVGQRNHSRNACLVNLIEPDALRTSQVAERKNAMFSPILQASEGSLSYCSRVSSLCSSCENLDNSDMLTPLFLLGGNYPQASQDVHAVHGDEDRQNLLLLRMNAFRKCYLDNHRHVPRQSSQVNSLVTESQSSYSDDELSSASQQRSCYNNSRPPTSQQSGRDINLPVSPRHSYSCRSVHDVFPVSQSTSFKSNDAPDPLTPPCQIECLTTVSQKLHSDKVLENISPSPNVSNISSQPSQDIDREVVSQNSSSNDEQTILHQASSSKCILKSSGLSYPSQGILNEINDSSILNNTLENPIPGGSKSRVFLASPNECEVENRSENLLKQLSCKENLANSQFNFIEKDNRRQNIQEQRTVGEIPEKSQCNHFEKDNRSQNIQEQRTVREIPEKSQCSHFEQESRNHNKQGQKSVKDNPVKSQFSHNLWAGFTTQPSERNIQKSHLCCSDEKLNFNPTESYNVHFYGNLCNSNESPNSSSNKRCLQDVSKEVSRQFISNTPTATVRYDLNGKIKETDLRENVPSTSSQALSHDKTNNSVRCFPSSSTDQNGQAKKPDIQEQNDEAIWKRVQPYFVVNSPGISTTWKCYYGSDEIHATTCSGRTSSTSICKNTLINDCAIPCHINRCPSRSPGEEHTEESKGCSQTIEQDTKETNVQEENSEGSALETSSDENANDNARNLAMSWSGSLLDKTAPMKHDYLSFAGKSLCDERENFAIPPSTLATAEVRRKSINPFVNLQVPSCSIDIHSPCTSHFEFNAVNGEPCSNNSSHAVDIIFSALKGEPCSNKSLPTGDLEVSNILSESGTRNISLQTISNQHSYRQLQTNRKRHLNADTISSTCKRPRLNSRVFTKQLSPARRISRYLRRSRFQIMRELKYLNERQAEKQKRSTENCVEQSLRMVDVERHGESSDADSESSV